MLNTIKNTLLTVIGGCWPWIVLAIAVLLLGIVYRKGLKNYAKQLLLCLVKTAEDSYGAGTGAFKYAAVASMLYARMPASFRVIFTERQVSVLIEAAVTAMKETLEAVAAKKTPPEETPEAAEV